MTVPYEVAKKVFIEQDQQAGMQAFMQGQIKVEGDMSKLMAMQTQQPSAEQAEVSEEDRGDHRLTPDSVSSQRRRLRAALFVFVERSPSVG